MDEAIENFDPAANGMAAGVFFSGKTYPLHEGLFHFFSIRSAE